MKRRLWSMLSVGRGGAGQGTRRPDHFRTSGTQPGKGGTEYDEIGENWTSRTRGEWRLRPGREIMLASFNARSLLKPAMHHQIAVYMKSRNISLMALQETKVSTVTQYMVGDYLYVLSGSGEEGSREHAGVGVVLSKEARKWRGGFTVRR